MGTNKSKSFPKHHMHKGIPMEIKAYLTQLEAALSASADEKQKLEKRVIALEAKLNTVARRFKIQA